MVAGDRRRVGRVDILVDDAGGGLIGPKGLDTADAEWDTIVDLNLKGQFLCCRAVAAPMRRQRRGRIVNVASNAGRHRSNTGFGDLAYSAAKGGMLQLTAEHGARARARRHHRQRDRPGSVLSARGWREFEALPDELRERVIAETPLRPLRRGRRDRQHRRVPRLGRRELRHGRDHRGQRRLVRRLTREIPLPSVLSASARAS